MQQRKLLRPYLAFHVQAFVADARADIDALAAEHERELAAIRRELDELRGITSDVVAVLVEQADERLAALRKQLELALVKLIPPHDGPLH
jgi:hypothetical protein